MRRRELFGAPAVLAGLQTGTELNDAKSELVIERSAGGKPHAGKVLAFIQPHSDDIQLAGGLVAKLMAEGYTGYLIRTTNDECAGPGSVGETVLANERDNNEVARILGMKQVFDFNYRNHRMDGISDLEYRARLIFLIRLLKIDTVVSYDPWGHYEENPDHYVTASGVEAACWMANGRKDYPEHFAAGLEPHRVSEKYYFARGPQLVNRVVDITAHIEKKIDLLLAGKAQGPAGERGARLRAELASRGLKLPLLGEDDETANRAYIREFLLADEREMGKKYGLEYAEAYHYIGPAVSRLDDYIKKNAVPLK